MSPCQWTLSVKYTPLEDQPHLLVEVEEATGAVLVVEGCKALDGPIHIHGVSVEGTMSSKQHPVGEGPAQEHLGEGLGVGQGGVGGVMPCRPCVQGSSPQSSQRCQ